MIQSKELLKIGEFASAAGTNLRTLRYYEELGLITPALRSDGGFRYYRPTDVNRVLLIRDLQELGLQLEKIRELMGSRHRTEERCAMLERVRTALNEHAALLAERMRTLESQRERVSVALEQLGTCTGCTHAPATKNNFCEPCKQTGEPLPELISALF